jgi:hypothetical protein
VVTNTSTFPFFHNVLFSLDSIRLSLFLVCLNFYLQLPTQPGHFHELSKSPLCILEDIKHSMEFTLQEKSLPQPLRHGPVALWVCHTAVILSPLSRHYFPWECSFVMNSYFLEPMSYFFFPNLLSCFGEARFPETIGK